MRVVEAPAVASALVGGNPVTNELHDLRAQNDEMTRELAEMKNDPSYSPNNRFLEREELRLNLGTRPGQQSRNASPSYGGIGEAPGAGSSMMNSPSQFRSPTGSPSSMALKAGSSPLTGRRTDRRQLSPIQKREESRSVSPKIGSAHMNDSQLAGVNGVEKRQYNDKLGLRTQN